ncbi:MAG: hypothetical protein RIC55_28990 [Pirellulaceae bacterium]
MLFVLVVALPVLVVAFAVVMGGQALARATGDTVGGSVLFYVGMTALMLLAADLLLLVAVLGVNALAQSSSSASSDETPDDAP